jgi:hypothetical protein
MTRLGAGSAWGQDPSICSGLAPRSAIAGAALTAYDPSCDADGHVCRAALTLLEVLANVAATGE